MFLKSLCTVSFYNRNLIRIDRFPSSSVVFRRLFNMKIGTHDGVFHCDEVLACFMLKLLSEYKDADIVRTRDSGKLDECDIVVDVGAVFDHKKKRYDHHQREFAGTLSSLRPELGEKYKIKYNKPEKTPQSN